MQYNGNDNSPPTLASFLNFASKWLAPECTTNGNIIVIEIKSNNALIEILVIFGNVNTDTNIIVQCYQRKIPLLYVTL